MTQANIRKKSRVPRDSVQKENPENFFKSVRNGRKAHLDAEKLLLGKYDFDQVILTGEFILDSTSAVRSSLSIKTYKLLSVPWCPLGHVLKRFCWFWAWI